MDRNRDEVFIGPDSWLLAIGEETGKAVISIGDRCSFAGGLTLSAVSGLVIGNDVLVGRNVHISDHAHAHSDLTLPIMRQGVSEAKAVSVGDGAWIGQGVVICPGVRIGRNAVVGANSVVRCDVPDFTVAAGVPARLIRRVDGKPLEG